MPTPADKTIPKYRPNSAPPLKPRKFLEAEERAREEVPAHVKDIYDQIYSDIMEEIIEGRVYKEPALRKVQLSYHVYLYKLLLLLLLILLLPILPS